MKRFVLSVVLIATAVSFGRADLLVTLDNGVVDAAPGGNAIFTGKLTNTGSEALNLDSIEYSFDGSSGNYLNSLLLDQDPFYNGTVPVSLAANGSYSGPIFGLALTTDSVGTLSGTATIDWDVNGVDTFQTPVGFRVNAVPEPGAAVGLAIGLALYCRRRIRT